MSTNDATTNTTTTDLITELEHQADQNGEDEDLVVALNAAIATLARQAAASVVQGPR